MSSPHNTTSGVVLKTEDGKVYFLPQRVLDGFAVNNSPGIEMLTKAIQKPTQTHEAFSVSIDPNLARDIFIF